MDSHSTHPDSFLYDALRSYIETCNDMVFIKDTTHTYRSCSKGFLELVEKHDHSDVIGKTDSQLFSNPLVVKRYQEEDDLVMAGKGPIVSPKDLIDLPNGRRMYASTTKTALTDSQGNLIGIVGTIKDVMNIYSMKKNYEREVGFLFQLPPNGLYAFLIDVNDWKLLESNSGESLLGIRQDQEGSISQLSTYIASCIVAGSSARDFLTKMSKQVILDMYESGNRSFGFEYQFYNEQVGLLWVEMRFRLLQDPVNCHIGLFASIVDINARKLQEQELVRAAQFDMMTGLYNRATTMKKIQEALEAGSHGALAALFMVDVDNLKQINDTYGHPVGDQVLKDFSHQLRKAFQPDDIIGRIGGDEFLIFAQDVTLKRIHELAGNLSVGIQSLFSKGTQLLMMSGSIGISVTSSKEKTLEQLYHEADVALYGAKEGGKNRYQIFQERDPDNVGNTPVRGIESLNLQRILNRLDSGIVVFRIDMPKRITKVLFMSDSYLRLVGETSREEAASIYRDWTLSYIHPEDVQRVRMTYLRSLSACTSVSIVFRQMGKDGMYRWLSASHSLSKTETGEIEDFAVFTDITQYKAIESTLIEKNQIIEMGLANSSISIMSIDLQNDICQRMRPGQDANGQGLVILENYPQCLIDNGQIHERSIETVRSTYAAIKRGEREVSCEVWVRCPNRMQWWCEQLSITTLVDCDGKPSRAIAIGKDITDMRRKIDEYSLFQDHHPKRGVDVAFCRVDLTNSLMLDGFDRSNTQAHGVFPVPIQKYHAGFLQSIVEDTQREEVAKQFNRESLLQMFDSGTTELTLEVCCMSRKDVGELQWLCISITMYSNHINNAVEACIYFQDVDMDRRSAMMINKLFIHDYEMLAQIQPTDGSVLFYRENIGGVMGQPTSQKLLYQHSMEQLVNTRISPAFRQAALVGLSLEQVKRQLQDADSYSCSFPVRTDGSSNYRQKQWRFCYVDSSKTDILLTRSDITKYYEGANDPLSGLLCRQAFYQQATDMLNDNPEVHFVLMRFDIDRFKVFNDLYGVTAGDELLQVIGATLLACNPGELTVLGRLEADHFAILCPYETHCWELLPKKLQELSQGMQQKFNLQFSIGLLDITDTKLDVSLMCDRALLAMDQVKASYTDKVSWYDEQQWQKILEEQMLVSECEAALEHGQFQVYYQPVVNYMDGSIIGAEALVRWIHPVHGMISPARFISLFERNGFIGRLDLYVWDQACRFMANWEHEHGQKFPFAISVNISRIDIYDVQLCEKIIAIQDLHGLQRDCLKLEITEGVYMEDPQQLIEAVKVFRKAGFVVAMDDFGAGYSSLNILKDVPVDILKLDLRFLSKGEDDARGGSIISSIIRMARWLNLTVVAEGVETKQQADFLKSLNCRYMQGFYFYRPIDGAAFNTLLQHSDATQLALRKEATTSNIQNFWDPNAQMALLFNEFLGGSAILEFHGGTFDLAQCNDKFYHEFEIPMAQRDMFHDSMSAFFDQQALRSFTHMIERAIQSGKETECEVPSHSALHQHSSCWTVNRARVLDKTEDRWLIFVSSYNTTRRNELATKLDINRDELAFTIFHLGGMVGQFDIQSRRLTICEEYGSRYGFSTVLENVPYGVEHVVPEYREAYVQMYEQIMAGSPCGSAVVALYRTDGKISKQHVNYSTIFSKQRKPVQAIISVSHITIIEQDAQGNVTKEHQETNDQVCLLEYDYTTDKMSFRSRSVEDGVRSFSVRHWSRRMRMLNTIDKDSMDAVLPLVSMTSEVPLTGTVALRADCWGHGMANCRLTYRIQTQGVERKQQLFGCITLETEV